MNMENRELIDYNADYDGVTSLATARSNWNMDSDKYGDRTFKILEDTIAIVKTESAIAKKEADMAALATKTYMESEKSYVEFLKKDCRREGITPEEIRENKNEIKDAQLRMKEESERVRNTLENSPYRQPGKWKLPAAVGICAIITIFGGRYFLPRVA